MSVYGAIYKRKLNFLKKLQSESILCKPLARNIADELAIVILCVSICVICECFICFVKLCVLLSLSLLTTVIGEQRSVKTVLKIKTITEIKKGQALKNPEEKPTRESLVVLYGL